MYVYGEVCTYVCGYPQRLHMCGYPQRVEASQNFLLSAAWEHLSRLMQTHGIT